MSKKENFKEVEKELGEDGILIDEEEVEIEDILGKPTLFDRIKSSKWLKRAGWGLLAVTVAAAGAVLLAGCNEEEEVVDEYLEDKSEDEETESSKDSTERDEKSEN